MEIETQAAPVAEAQPQADVAVENQPEAPIEEQKPETQEVEPKADPFPKKAVNAITRRDRQIGKQRAMIEQLNAEIAKLREKPEAALKGEPKEADYSNYAEYLEARQAHLIEQKIAALKGEQQKDQQTASEQAWIAEREQTVATQAQEFLKENPEARAVIEEYADVIDDFPPALERLFLEADNAPLAFYNLAKDGQLEQLASLPISRAAMLIGMAQAKPLAKKQATKAPAPLSPAKGTGSGTKSPSQMTPEEIVKWATS